MRRPKSDALCNRADHRSEKGSRELHQLTTSFRFDPIMGGSCSSVLQSFPKSGQSPDSFSGLGGANILQLMYVLVIKAGYYEDSACHDGTATSWACMLKCCPLRRPRYCRPPILLLVLSWGLYPPWRPRHLEMVLNRFSDGRLIEMQKKTAYLSTLAECSKLTLGCTPR